MPTSDIAPPSRVLIQPGFAWDLQDAYLFDIDGTLLRSRDRIHFNSFAESIQHVMGMEISLSGVNLNGNTDTGILYEAFALAGLPAQAWQPQCEAILEAMRQTVLSRRAEFDLVCMPAVHEALAHLDRQGALLGLATGNLELIGWTKVEAAGLREWFRFGGFSDRFPVRSAMIADAADKAREILGPNGPEDPKICVVGDTPRDISAARDNGLSVIAVATGHYSFDDLAAHHPDACASSLSDLLALTTPQSNGSRP